MADDQDTPEERSQKSVAFYSAATQAWLDTNMQKDKAVLALSSGGLAFLGHLLVGEPPATCSQLILYALGAVGFLLGVLAVLWVLTRNADVLADAIGGGPGKDPVMEALDRIAMGSFVLGAAMTAALAFTINSGGSEMAKQEQQGPSQVTTQGSRGVPLGQSGVGALRPGGECRGYSGVGALRPAGQSGGTQGGGQSSGGQSGGTQGGTQGGQSDGGHGTGSGS